MIRSEHCGGVAFSGTIDGIYLQLGWGYQDMGVGNGEALCCDSNSSTHLNIVASDS